jgi:RNA polymerase sigma-70 factor (ECF subfamily)
MNREVHLVEACQGLSDEQLAAKARAGCSWAFDELAARCRPGLLRHLRRRTTCPQDAEDLAQDTFLKAFQNLTRYDTGRPFVAWLLTIAKRLAISHSRGRREWSALGEWDLAGGPDPQVAAAEAEAVGNLWARARRDLTPSQYRALYLRCADEKSVRDIARQMDLTQIHVKVLLHRARRRLLNGTSGKPDGPAGPETYAAGSREVRTCGADFING